MAKSNRKVKLDMTGVESYTRCPEGEHLVKVKKAEMGTVQGSGDDCIKAVFEVLKGEGKGCQVFETFSLSEKALWKLKSFLTAIGLKADGKFQLDLDKIEGKTCVIDVIHEEYNGQKRAKISEYLKESSDEEEDEDYDDEEDEEEPPKKKPGKKSKKQPEPEDEDEDEEEDDEEEPPKKSKKSSKKSAPAKADKKPGKKSKKQPEPEEDEDDEDDDWDEDDDD